MNNSLNLIGSTLPISELSAEQQATLAEGKLCFEETLTIDQFKHAALVDTIITRRNPKTGKLFFTYGAKSGMVSSKITSKPEHPMISHVIGFAKTKAGELIPGMAEHMLLLHNEGEGGAPVVFTF